MTMTGPESPLLRTAVRAAQSVIHAINEILPEDIVAAANMDRTAVFDYRLQNVKYAVNQLATVLSADMPDIASYVVSQKGIYRTEDLIAHAEQHMGIEVRENLPELAKTDLREAGKCLAYEVPTACSFHLWRAVETTMEYYHQALTGKTFEEAAAGRNWVDKIRALNAVKADKKVTAFLDHIRGEYRNPTAHSGEFVPLEEAKRLFTVGVSSIEQMVLKAAALRAAPPAGDSAAA